MPITPTPPIQLDPSMDKGHELAFINQNFNNIASVIGQNSFVIIQSGTTNITTLASVDTVSTTVTHNLGFIPVGMFYVNNSSQFVPLPWTLWGSGAMQLALYVSSVDSSTITFQLDHTNALYNSKTFSVKYYLLQQTAN